MEISKEMWELPDIDSLDNGGNNRDQTWKEQTKKSLQYELFRSHYNR